MTFTIYNAINVSVIYKLTNRSLSKFLSKSLIWTPNCNGTTTDLWGSHLAKGLQSENNPPPSPIMKFVIIAFSLPWHTLATLDSADVSQPSLRVTYIESSESLITSSVFHSFPWWHWETGFDPFHLVPPWAAKAWSRSPYSFLSPEQPQSAWQLHQSWLKWSQYENYSLVSVLKNQKAHHTLFITAGNFILNCISSPLTLLHFLSIVWWPLQILSQWTPFIQSTLVSAALR